MSYQETQSKYASSESLRLEAVTTCVGFDDILDVTLQENHSHVDTMIVVTSHADKATQKVAQKHGATCVQTDLFYKNGRNFNKGAAVNAGFDYFQYHGWRLHLDSDIVLPDNFRRILFNHTHLDPSCVYGCDRVDVIARAGLNAALSHQPQHHGGMMVRGTESSIGHRWSDNLRGYVPLGFFQLWNSSCQKPYPYSLGTAAHDDLMFAGSWPLSQRRHLPTVICYHVVARPPVIGENWDGKRRQPRIQ